MSVDHIGITSRDIDKSIAFYKEVLGFKEYKAWGQDKGRIVMLKTDQGACIEIFADGNDLLPEGAYRHIAFRVDDVRETFQRAKDYGQEIIREPIDMDLPSDPPSLVTLAFFKGPDGELIELFQEKR